ncbi:hypothetical protein ACIQZN_28995 [Streptomyces sp. NPDC097595]|uniref:hypothetical protein n=1 Tax=Streptomyces sp. NPDC097595 TaxID=3366090 RepID=UPI003827950B
MGISSTGTLAFWTPTVFVCAVIAVVVWRRQRETGLLRPVSMVALCCMALLNAVTAWLLGASQVGLDLKESCEFRHGVSFDEAWNDVHYAESQKFFPLHSKCSATVDLVPAWVNPAIIALTLLAVGFLCGAVCLRVRDFVQGGGETSA